MKTLLASTAIAALIALPVAAQSVDSTLPANGDQRLAVHDLNEDGVIDMADLDLADTNSDGVVDANDAPQMAATDAAPLAPETGTDMAAGTDGTMAPEASDTELGTDMAAGTDAAVGDGVMVSTETDMAADITGERVYDSTDTWIGEVSEIVVADGKSWAIIDVGGFLGIGEKPVALDISELEITQEGDDANDVKVSVAKTKAELEAMPTYEKM